MAVEVYSSGAKRHLSSRLLLDEINYLAGTECNVISDSAAQSIAAQWHSPRKGNTTLLSNRGIVMSDTDIDDFADPEEYDNCDDWDKLCLDMLKIYIQTKKQEYLSKYKFLCPHCFKLAVRDFNKNPGTRKQEAWEREIQRVECENCYEPLMRWWSDARGWSGWDPDHSSM